jgi:hypothetical protein
VRLARHQNYYGVRSATGLDGVHVFLVTEKSSGLQCPSLPLAFENEAEAAVAFDAIVCHLNLQDDFRRNWPLKNFPFGAAIEKAMDALPTLEEYLKELDACQEPLLGSEDMKSWRGHWFFDEEATKKYCQNKDWRPADSQCLVGSSARVVLRSKTEESMPLKEWLFEGRVVDFCKIPQNKVGQASATAGLVGAAPLAYCC